MTTIAICLGTTSRMSLVRMCTVTLTLFRMCMCMCLRARERERRETSSKGSDTELVPILDSSKSGCMEKRELSITREHVPVSVKPFHSLTGLILHPFIEADDLKSIVGPYSPKRQLTDNKEPSQMNFTSRHLKTGLQWLSNRVDEHHEMFLNGVKSQISEQEEPRIVVEEAEEVDRRFMRSPVGSPVPHTIAWSECDSFVVESPSCITYQHQQRVDGKHSVRAVVGVDEKLKTLVDELLETDRTTYTDGACLADFGGPCQCSQLPNQILATLTPACSMNFLIEDDLKEELTTGGERDQQASG